jgi:hypothetical protein
VLAMSDIIDFLLGLLRDEDARAEFAQNPQASLERAGLEGVTGQDVRDAQLQMADTGVARSGGEGRSHSGGDDPVREISYTTQHYHVAPDAPDSGGAPVITIDDRDTTFNNTFTNSFNSDDDITVIDDSFNDVDVSDDDVTNNTDVDVRVVDIDAEGSFNTTEDNDVVAIQDNDTITEDNDVVAIQDNDVNGGDSPIDVDVTGGVTPGAGPAPAADPAAVSGPAEVDVEPVAETPADQPADDPVDDPVDDTADDALPV